MSIVLSPARSAEAVEDFRALCREYVDWLFRDFGIRLDFQGIDEELRSLPGDYAPPRGEIVLAHGSDGRTLGCIAVRPFSGSTCEVKRLYVRPEARGARLGHRLAAAILHEARDLGYTRAVLDTGGFMGAAQRVYQTAGFSEIPPYYENPVPGVRYFGRDL